MPINWVDGVTPVNAANMEIIDTDIAALQVADGLKVDKDAVTTAAARLVASKLLAGDAQPAFQVNGDGTIAWGIGGATAPDMTFGRNSNPLAFGTPALFAQATVVASGYVVSRAAGANAFVGVGLIPSGAGSPNTFVGLTYDVANNRADLSALSGGVAWRNVFVGENAALMVNQINFGTTNANFDTFLYRTTATVLKTDGSFRAAGYIDVDFADSGGKLRFGSAVDTNLYRAAAGVLKSDGFLILGGPNGYLWNPAAPAGILLQAQVLGAGNAAFSVDFDGRQKWGAGGASVLDTLLYRDTSNPGIGALALRTNRSLIVELGVQCYGGADPAVLLGYTGNRVFQIRNAGKLEWGPGGTDAVDSNLYRFGANQLKTDGDLYTGNGIVVGLGGLFTDAVHGIRFGSGGDTNIYRSAAGVLKTDGILNAVGGLQINGVAVGAGGPGAQVAYGEITSPVAGISQNTSATAATVVTSSAFTADGTSKYLVEIFAARVLTVSGGGIFSAVIYDGATEVGIVSESPGSDGAGRAGMVRGSRVVTPSAGSHTFSFRAFASGSNGSVSAGTGAAGQYAPAYIRVTKVT